MPGLLARSQQCEASCPRQGFVEQVEPLLVHVGELSGHAGHVAARARQRRHETRRDRIRHFREDDGYGIGQPHQDLRGWCGVHEKHLRSACHQLLRERLQSVLGAISPARGDDEILPLDITELPQALPQHLPLPRAGHRGLEIEHGDATHGTGLGPRLPRREAAPRPSAARCVVSLDRPVDAAPRVRANCSQSHSWIRVSPQPP
jgi:hypothetical protein